MKIISLEMKLEMRDLIFDRISQHLILDALIECERQESSRSLNDALVMSWMHKDLKDRVRRGGISIPLRYY